MTDDGIPDWLGAWFARRTPEVTLRVEDNFFDKNAVDSFGVIELIEDIEAQFAIAFVETDYQDRRFPTIAGLSEIIAMKKTRAEV